MSDSLLADLGVTLLGTGVGVFGAQWLSNLYADSRDRKAETKRLDQLSIAMVECLQHAMAATWRARCVLEKAGQAPEIRIQADYLIANATEAVLLYRSSPQRFEHYMMAASFVPIVNRRLDLVAEAELRMAALPYVDRRDMDLHIADALAKLKKLDEYLLRVLAFLDPEAASKAPEAREGALSMSPHADLG